MARYEVDIREEPLLLAFGPAEESIVFEDEIRTGGKTEKIRREVVRRYVEVNLYGTFENIEAESDKAKEKIGYSLKEIRDIILKNLDKSNWDNMINGIVTKLKEDSPRWQAYVGEFDDSLGNELKLTIRGFYAFDEKSKNVLVRDLFIICGKLEYTPKDSKTPIGLYKCMVHAACDRTLYEGKCDEYFSKIYNKLPIQIDLFPIATAAGAAADIKL